MAAIDAVRIEGFWGNHTVEIGFDHKVNFLVGRNGSGKTTAIDILASALQCDQEALERLPYKKIEIVFFDPLTKKKPSLIVEKVVNDKMVTQGVEYRLRDSAKTPLKDARVFRPFDYRETRILSPAARWNALKHGVLPKMSTEVVGIAELKAEISRLIRMNWLSINRVSSIRSTSEWGSTETLVDRKLREISDHLERYFSELSSNASLVTRNFQRKLFRSLVQTKAPFSLRDNVKGLDLPVEKASIVDIFERFGLPETEYKRDVEEFYEDLTKLQSVKNKDSFSLQEVVSLVNAHKIHSLVGQWIRTIEAEKQILKPRDAFVRILDSMFHKKEASVLPSGEIEFSSRSGKKLRIFDLSSGEKQLFILLGEALLQRDAEWTYIADEPELSLHVDWQEKLVDNLRALNPNAQVIFATHSPDIVSHYGKYVLNMEHAIK